MAMSLKGKKPGRGHPDETGLMIGKRLFEFRKVLGIEPGRLAEVMKVSAARLLRIEQGKGTLPSDRLMRLHRHFGINILWLLTGVGSMFDKIIAMEKKFSLLIELLTLIKVPEVGADILNTLERAKIQFKDEIQEAIDQGRIII